MNHSLSAYISATLSLLGVPTFFSKAAKSDFKCLLRMQEGLDSLPEDELAIRETKARKNTEGYRGRLRRKTFISLAWVLSAVIIAGYLFVPIQSITQQQVFAILSIISFSWGTLGRLGWNERSYGGSTIFEELDAAIFWALYWIGAFSGIGTLVSAT